MSTVRANVIVPDLNPCGGGERLTLVTMQALSQMRIDFDLTTLRSPDISRLENAYGKTLVSVMKNIKKINVIDILEELRIQLPQQEKQQLEGQIHYEYDITINTHPDSTPYFHPSFSKNNSIVYCHYPAAKYHIESENIGYLEKDIEIEDISSVSSYGNNNNNNNKLKKTTIKEYFRILKYGYWNLMRNSTIVTNSEFTRNVIVEAFGTDYNNICILRPPIDVDTFRNAKLISEQDYDAYYHNRDDIVIVISRIAAHKEIENAIKLAKILKDKNIGKGMIIIGNLYNYFEYHAYLKQMIIELGLTDFVTFEINASLDKLLALMRKSKICFSPRPEPFGMAILEAMAAGLIPIVPSTSGSTEFVPGQFHYSTLEEAAGIISWAFQLPDGKRVKRSNSVDKFSSSRYIEGFKRLINEVMPNTRPN
jgi:alpha-1,2-mannosyltransferase